MRHGRSRRSFGAQCGLVDTCRTDHVRHALLRQLLAYFGFREQYGSFYFLLKPVPTLTIATRPTVCLSLGMIGGYMHPVTVV